MRQNRLATEHENDCLVFKSNSRPFCAHSATDLADPPFGAMGSDGTIPIAATVDAITTVDATVTTVNTTNAPLYNFRHDLTVRRRYSP